jgi:hypothetical protein
MAKTNQSVFSSVNTVSEHEQKKLCLSKKSDGKYGYGNGIVVIIFLKLINQKNFYFDNLFKYKFQIKLMVAIA